MWGKDLKIVKSLVEKISKNIQSQLDTDLGEIAYAVESKKELEKEISALKIELNEIKHKKKMEEEDLKHMVKMREEALDVKFQKKVLDVTQEHSDKIAKVKDEYRDKIETRLEKETVNIKEMYNQILERLPNVNVALQKGFENDTNINVNKGV